MCDLSLLGADGQESRRLVHHKDVSVLVEYHEAVRQETWTGAFTHGNPSVGDSDVAGVLPAVGLS